MTGQNSKRKAVQNSSRNKNSSKNTRSSSNNKNNSVSTEAEELNQLKRKISELQSKVDELTNKQNQSQSLDDDNDSQDEVVSDDSSPSTKRQMRKKPSNEDEKAKFVIKKLLENYPPDLSLKDELIFTSKENTDICEKLIPKLQKDVKKSYNLSYEQLKEWLQNFHKSKRSAYLNSKKLNHDKIDNSPEAESDDTVRPAKRRTKSKGKKPGNLSEDDEEAKNEEGSRIEEGAKLIMRTYLNNVSPDLDLKDDLVFTSKENIDICEKLIPKLQKEVKPGYNLSNEQVKKWLKNFHQTRRRKHAKSNKMDLD